MSLPIHTNNLHCENCDDLLTWHEKLIVIHKALPRKLSEYVSYDEPSQVSLPYLTNFVLFYEPVVRSFTHPHRPLCPLEGTQE